MVHKKKPDVVTTFPNYDLHGAAAAGNIGLVLYAITHGQPINAVLGGLLPLHAAASGGSVEVVQLLINQGADVNVPRLPSNTGPPIGVGGAGSLIGPSGVIGDHHHPGTPVDKFQKVGRLNSSSGTSQQASSSHGRPGSATTQQTLPIGVRGSTPLHFAAAMGHMDVVRLLLENGARPAMKDAEKATPEMVARNAKQFRIADFIRDWQAQSPIDAPRSSLDAPGPSNQRLDVPSPDLNASTTSLPLGISSPAAQSTSSLGRYPNQPVRRPSLPSIYESPPSTSYLRPGSSKRQASTPEGPLSKLPFTVRRPKSAGTKESGGGSADDTASLASHVSTSSRLNRIFKRPNLRPATASGALTTPSPKSSSPPPIGRSRSPSAGRVPEKERSGGLLHGHLPHLPHLHRHHFHGSHHPHPVSRDAISGPFVHGQSPSTSIPDFARPELADGAPLTGSTNPRDSPAPGDVSTSPEEMEDEDALRKALNLTPGELQYAKMRGTLQDRKGSARTAPAAQMSFGLAPKTSAPNLNQYSTLSAKSSPAVSPNGVPLPRHRANLGPGGGLAMTAAQGSSDQVQRFRTETPLSFNSTDTGNLSVRAAHPVPSLSSLNQVVNSADIRNYPDYPSSPGASSGGSSSSHDMLRSPEGIDDSTVEQSSRHVPHPTLKKSRSLLSSPFSQTSPHSSPSVSSVGYAGSGTDYISAGIHSSPFIGGKPASRAQAQELVEAHRRAIESGHEQRVKTRRAPNSSSRHQNQDPEQAREDDKKLRLEVEQEDTGTASQQEEEDMMSLREKLAALGDLVQQERRLAKGEKQGVRWNRESALEDASTERGSVDLDKVGPSSMGASTILRSEMLDGYLRQGEVGGSERVRRPPTPKRDVFGRPVTPKQQKEGRPTTPKDARPATPKSVTTPTTSKILDAPRENRILPPPSKAPPARTNTQHLTLQQTKAICKSDLALGSHVNKDDLQGRERAWTTTDVRPRVGPAGSSRPSTAGAKPSQNKDGLTIDIIQTMPTPTDGPVTPLQNPSPMPPSPTSDRQSLQSRRRCASNPLRIDAKGAQEKALSNDSYDGQSRESPSIPSHSDKPSQQSHSRPRKPSTPTGTKGEPSSILLHRITTTPPNVAPVVNVVAPSGTPFASFLPVSSNGNDAPESPSPTHTMPVPSLPSAVDLHNMHVSRAKEEAKKLLEGEMDVRHVGTWNGSPPVTAGERRLGMGPGRRDDFGYDSVRSFNEEKGGERLWQPPTSDTGKSTKSKLGGLFSRLKR